MKLSPSPLRVNITVIWAALSLLAVVSFGCSGSAETTNGPSVDLTDQDQREYTCEDGPSLEFMVFNCWGQRIEEPEIISGPLVWQLSEGSKEAMVEVQATGFEPATLTATWAGELTRESLTLSSSGDTLVVHSLEQPDGACPIYTVAIGMDHEIFACQAAAPSENNVTLFSDGAGLFGNLSLDLKSAKERIYGTTWWWQSDFEIVRPQDNHLLSQDDRRPFTVLSHLEENPDLDVKIIVSRFAPETMSGLAYVNTDPDLRAHAYDEADRFEVISQGNQTEVPWAEAFEPINHPVPFLSRVIEENPDLTARFASSIEQGQLGINETAEAASWHQKMWTVDGAIAYVSGMNIKSSDWDKDAHEVFEPQRMMFTSTKEERQAVLEKRAMTDVLPRKDYGVRIQGPGARDVDRIIKKRWDLSREMGELFSEMTTPFELLPEISTTLPVVLSQVVVTHPEPLGEMSILESMAKAIRNAKDLIYIEDQYFRMPIVLDAFREALDASPSLQVVVITKPVSDTDPAKKWTLHMNDALREMAGDRYLLLQVMAYDEGYLTDPQIPEPVFQPIDVHAKIIIVDNFFLSVGSCNKNNRGLLYEGEANVVVYDEDWVSQERQRVLTSVSLDPNFDWNSSGANVIQRMRALAQGNEAIKVQAESSGEVPEVAPSGFLYPLELTPDYLIDLGPDVF
jgi:phosphatidylserine/phosphatidylglycerophosphate/cardiolipin synthase-like enzyme